MVKKWYGLIDKVYNLEKLYHAFRQVKRNKGAAGIDGVTIADFEDNLVAELKALHHELKTGTYQPQPVLRVEIPKPNGGTRPLGIPTVRDRVVQQAVLNVLQPIFDPYFHPSSYGYRPGRSCHHAVAKARVFIQAGLEHVVDMDLSKCFDRLNHEVIIDSVAQRISDGKVLELIRKFLKSGVMKDGEYQDTEIGSPQGGVISPLLANIYLDYFDQKMKDKGIRIVRYADDILIFARTAAQAKQYYHIAANILENELKLTVNREKTHITNADSGIAFLGFMLYSGYISIHPKKIKQFKDTIRKLTPRNHGINIETIIFYLNQYLRGWAAYFRVANCKKQFQRLMQWIRRRLRMKQMREWKTWKQLHKALRRRGYHGKHEKISMRRWRNSACHLIHRALPNSWFDEIGLYNLERCETGTLSRYFREVLQEPYTRPVRTVL